MSLLENIGFDEGGQLPFYYNRRTGQAVNGATTYANLRKWGTGNLGALFNDMPQTLQQTEEENSFSKRKDIGNKAGFMEKIMDFGAKGREKAEENTRKVEESSSSSLPSSQSKHLSSSSKKKTNSSHGRGKVTRVATPASTSSQAQGQGQSAAAARTAARRAKRAAEKSSVTTNANT